MLHSICHQIWKLSSGHRTGKGKFSFQSLRKAKDANYHTITLISHVSEIMLKILQARLQQYMNHELPDVQAGFRKGKRPRDQIANIFWIAGSQHEELRPWQRSWGRRLWHTQRRDQTLGNPLFPSIYPQNQSLPTLLMLSPTPLTLWEALPHHHFSRRRS